MTAETIRAEVRRISLKLRDLNKDTPEMTGMDWASDHGWISQEEWEAAGEKSKQGVILQDAEVALIDALRRDHPEAMQEFMQAHLAWLKKIQHRLEQASHDAKKQKQEFAMRFNLSLLPDIIKALQGWFTQKPSKTWMAWAWRVAFSIGDECEKFLASHRSPDADSTHRPSPG